MNILSDYIKEIIAKTSGSIRFLGTGPSSPIKEKSGLSNRDNTSTLFSFRNKKFLIDVPPSFDKNIQFDYLLFTHQHRDAFGGFSKIEATDFILIVPKIFADISFKGRKIILKKHESESVDKVKITAFPVEHDRIYGYPTFGYQFQSSGKKITYSSDMVKIPKESEKYFDNIDLLVTDGAGWKSNLSTHFGILPFLDLVKEKKWKIGRIYFTQIGRPVPDHEDAQTELKETRTKTFLAYDGLQIHI
jgi:phosphoribosyl 1,2-cyclic phosphodiesterase